MQEASSPLTARQLLRMSKADLDDLFRASEPGPIPAGEGVGTVIFMPGTFVASPMATFANLFLWQGKVVNPVKGELRNRIFPIGFKGIRAKVYPDTSWFDGRACTLLDYSKTSLVAKPIRDEIRLVAPGLYLGIVYIRKRKTVSFALDFNAKPAGFVTRLKRAFGAG